MDPKWKMFEAPQRVVKAPRRLARKLDSAGLPGKRLQDDFPLESGQELPDAHVDSRTEADVANDLPLDVVFVRRVPLAWVAIGCS